MARRQPAALAAAIRQWSRKCPPQLVRPGCAHLFFVDTAKAVANQLSNREAILDLEAGPGITRHMTTERGSCLRRAARSWLDAQCAGKLTVSLVIAQVHMVPHLVRELAERAPYALQFPMQTHSEHPGNRATGQLG